MRCPGKGLTAWRAHPVVETVASDNARMKRPCYAKSKHRGTPPGRQPCRMAAYGSTRILPTTTAEGDPDVSVHCTHKGNEPARAYVWVLDGVRGVLSP